MNVKRIAKIDKALILDALFLMDWKHTLMTGKSFLEIKEKNGKTRQFLWQSTNRGPYTTISEKELSIKELLEVENINFETFSFPKKIKLLVEKVIPKRGSNEKHSHNIFSRYASSMNW